MKCNFSTSVAAICYWQVVTPVVPYKSYHPPLVQGNGLLPSLRTAPPLLVACPTKRGEAIQNGGAIDRFPGPVPPSVCYVFQDKIGTTYTTTDKM